MPAPIVYVALLMAVARPVGFLLGGPWLANRIKWAGFGLAFPPFVLVALARRLRGRTADNETPQDLAAHPRAVQIAGPSPCGR